MQTPIAIAAVALLAACTSSTSPSGTVQLQSTCVILNLQHGYDACTFRLVTTGGQTATIVSVALFGAGGQPVGGGFTYGQNIGLRLYTMPTPATLANVVFGPAVYEFEVVGAISVSEGEVQPPPGSYPGKVRVTFRVGTSPPEDVELGVTLVVP